MQTLVWTWPQSSIETQTPQARILAAIDLILIQCLIQSISIKFIENNKILETAINLKIDRPIRRDDAIKIFPESLNLDKMWSIYPKRKQCTYMRIDRLLKIPISPQCRMMMTIVSQFTYLKIVNKKERIYGFISFCVFVSIKFISKNSTCN
jgi:hypothetical protein